MPARVRTFAGWMRKHWLFIALFAVGVALRVVATFAYQPALYFVDTNRYLRAVESHNPGSASPLGYSFLLLTPLLRITGTLLAAAVANHLLGLLMGIGGYLLMLRWRVWPWLAAVGTAPVLLDAYQLQIEQLVMSDTMFQALLLLALLLLARRAPGPGLLAAAGGGVVLGVAGLTRLVGLACILAAVGYLLAAAPTWRRRVALVTTALAMYAVPMVGYAAYYASWNPGEFRITEADTMTAYARVAPVADCSQLDLADYQRVLCDPRPRDERPGPEFYHWSPDRPERDLRLPSGISRDDAVADFTHEVVVHQPFDVAGAVLHDFVRGLTSWSKTTGPGEPPAQRWLFPPGDYEHYGDPGDYRQYSAKWGGEQRTNEPLAEFMVAYQSVFFVRGTVVGGCLLLAVAGTLGLWRVRGSDTRAAVGLAAGLPVCSLLLAAGVEFSWRYQLPGIALLPIAGAMAVTAMFRRTEGNDVAMVDLEVPQAGTDAEALREFAERYADARFAPVVVVIAAYNEEKGIGAVVRGIPARSCGLDVQALVVDDGSPDHTAELARANGAYVCQAPRNRGQGAALRLGYRLACERGAQYIVTTDADGQYDIDELPLLLQPMVEGSADFVTGSRVLGSHQATNLARRVGTPFFAWLVSALTGTRVTDTSFGFRGMRTEVAGAVTLTQPQYQSSELLIGVLAKGYRVREQPMSMRQRNNGATKKGNTAVYGSRYLRVVLGTWWRERARNSRSSSTKRTANSTP